MTLLLVLGGTECEMKDENKTKEQLINELIELRQKNAELEKSVAEGKRAEEERDRLYREALAAREEVTAILESITDAFLAFNRQWQVIHMNSKAEQLLRKKRNDLIDKIYWGVFPDAVDTIGYMELHRAVAEQVTVEYEQFYPPLDTWFEARGFPSKDGISVFFRDITERKKAEKMIMEQQQAMLTLSTPVLQVRDQVLILPLIGPVDSARAAQIVEQLLNSIVNTQASIVIVDITGMPVIDTAVANHLIKTLQAATLLGEETIITGISPTNAQILVTLGVDLSMMNTKGSLRSGMKLADEMLRIKVVEKSKK